MIRKENFNVFICADRERYIGKAKEKQSTYDNIILHRRMNQSND